MNNWIIFTIVYAIFTALFECSKKKAVEKNSVFEVLTFFSTIAFILTMIISRDAFEIDYIYLPVILLKSLLVVIAWILAVNVLKKMQISLYSLIRISYIIFAVLLSYFILGEQITYITLIGMSIVICGLILVNKRTNIDDNKENKKTTFKLIILLLISCLLNAISAIIDKKVLVYISSSQLQFWFMLFITLFYWLLFIIKKEKINFNKIKTNYWIPMAAICLIIADRFLFIANEDVNSQVVIMTMLKQLSTVFAIILGRLLFKEKEIVKKLLYSVLIILGIGVMFIS